MDREAIHAALADISADGDPTRKAAKLASLCSGLFHVLGPLESLARTRLRQLAGPYGPVQNAQPEELLVERVLVSVYPQTYEPARSCAKMLAAVAVRGQLQMDWAEVKRLAALPEYRILPECETLVREVADELKVTNPLDSAR